MKITFQVDDRIATAAGGAFASLGLAAAAAILLRRHARVQAACWSLLGRPVAYRLHLHGTGIELAPWERNLVAECVVRDAPASGVRIGPVEPRPDEAGSVVRDTHVHRARGDGFRFGEAGTAPDAPWPTEPREGEETRYPLPAVCINGHEFEASRFARLSGRAELRLHANISVTCPECGANAYIRAGRYSVRDGGVVREDLPPEDSGPGGEA